MLQQLRTAEVTSKHLDMTLAETQCVDIWWKDRWSTSFQDMLASRRRLPVARGTNQLHHLTCEHPLFSRDYYLTVHIMESAKILQKAQPSLLSLLVNYSCLLRIYGKLVALSYVRLTCVTITRTAIWAWDKTGKTVANMYRSSTCILLDLASKYTAAVH